MNGWQRPSANSMPQRSRSAAPGGNQSPMRITRDHRGDLDAVAGNWTTTIEREKAGYARHLPLYQVAGLISQYRGCGSAGWDLPGPSQTKRTGPIATRQLMRREGQLFTPPPTPPWWSL